MKPPAPPRSPPRDIHDGIDWTECCEERCTIPGLETYYCTESKKHTGDHFALSKSCIVLACWPNTSTSTAHHRPTVEEHNAKAYKMRGQDLSPDDWDVVAQEPTADELQSLPSWEDL